MKNPYAEDFSHARFVSALTCHKLVTCAVSTKVETKTCAKMEINMSQSVGVVSGHRCGCAHIVVLCHILNCNNFLTRIYLMFV